MVADNGALKAAERRLNALKTRVGRFDLEDEKKTESTVEAARRVGRLEGRLENVRRGRR